MNQQIIPAELRPITDDAVSRLQRSVAAPYSIYLRPERIPAGTEVVMDRKQATIGRETYLIFADEQPNANWGHPCRYLLYDAKSLQLYEEIRAEFPPRHLQSSFAVGFSSFKQVEDRAIRPPPAGPLEYLPFYKPSSRKRFALLFAGEANARHVNDLEFLYRSLIDIYDVPRDQIYVLNYDGKVNADDSGSMTRWPGDGTPYRLQVNGAGTKSEFEKVIDELKMRLKPGDRLLLHTNGHGGRGAYLCAFQGQDLWANYVEEKLNELPAFGCFIAMMEQCYSGGFLNSVLQNTKARARSIATAANASNESHGDGNFNPFALHWIAAMAGMNADGSTLPANPDADSDGKLVAREAFNYAHVRRHPQDTPQFQWNGPEAEMCHLGTDWDRRPMYAHATWIREAMLLKVRDLEPREARAKIKEVHDRVTMLREADEAETRERESKIRELFNGL